MRTLSCTRYVCCTLAALIVGAGGMAYTQAVGPTNALPNP